MKTSLTPKCLLLLSDKAAAIPASMSWYRKTAWRVAVLALAIALFCGGAYWSFSGLAISPRDFAPLPLAILVLLTLPSLLYGGIAMMLLARSSGLSIPIGKATVIGAYAYLAELLPLPGGAIVRAGALVKNGVTVKRSSALVVLTGILWISLGMTGAGFALVPSDWRLGLPLLILGSGFAIAIGVWLWLIAGLAVALQTIGHRIVGIALIGLRLQFAFATLHVSVGLSETLPFVLAGLVGSASSIAPAGLGVGESLAALAATTTTFAPGTAFLAVGLDRVISLAACGCTAAFVQIAKRTSAINLAEA